MSIQGEWRIIDLMRPARITFDARRQSETSINFESRPSLTGAFCLDDSDNEEFRAVTRNSSTAC